VSVYHCPLCPLIFQFRSEVDWHLRNEHRSAADDEHDLSSELSTAGGELDEGRLAALRCSAGHPSVSMLLATSPGPTMSSLDVARLRHLTQLARRRLAAEPGGVVNPILEHRLVKAVAAAEANPADHGLAILVNNHHLAILRLPIEPHDRTVIDPAFATRDLEYALQQHPRYRVLVLGGHPRLLEGRAAHLAEVTTSAIDGGPLIFGRGHRGLGRRSSRPERWSLRRERMAAGIGEADRLLDEGLETSGPLPLVITGDNRWRSEFTRRSRHAATVIGIIHGTRTTASAAVLADLAKPALGDWRQTQQSRRIAELHDADHRHQIVWGLGPAWRAVGSGDADRLWVEHGYAQPGRQAPGVDEIEMTSDPAEPGISDDLVDDLIQLAARRGIAVDIVEEDSLGPAQRVAVRLRSGVPEHTRRSRPAAPVRGRRPPAVVTTRASADR
jgi:hypothetical protein